MVAPLVLNRNELAKFLPDSASIRQFEDLFSTTNTTSEQTATNTSDIASLTAAVAAKVDSTRTISTTAPLTGGGDLSANRTISIHAASTTVNGYLTSTDWNTFNGKQAALGYTAANDALVVHLAGTETMTGVKTINTLKAGSINLEGTPTGSFASNRLLLQHEGSSVARCYVCGVDGSTLGKWEFYSATSSGSPVLMFVYNGVGVGFNGTAPIAKPTVTGSRAGNAALASVLTALASYGLITDSSTA